MIDSLSLDGLLERIAALSDAGARAGAAQRLARTMSADAVIVFVRDLKLGRSLPAPGFPQTLPGAKAWRALIEEAIESGSAQSSVTGPDGSSSTAHAIGTHDGTVAAFLGESVESSGLNLLRLLLPLIGAMLRAEGSTHHAEAEATLARQSASQSEELAAKLDSTRAELRRALTLAESATSARDDFLATVSHELRTPLTSMIGWIQLLGDGSDPALLSQGLETIGRNARAQSRLIEDILDFSRINAGKLRLDVRPVELDDIIRDAIAIVTPGAGAKKIVIDHVLDPNSGHISGDPDRLQQVLWNLLSNAVKFTPRSGRIQVRLERIESHAVVSVTDNGAGIPPQFLPQVFDRFSQADASSTRVHSGLGLGLGIVKYLVELHGGTVEALSSGPGTGSTFRIHLPVTAAYREPEPPRASASEAVPPKAQPPNTLGDLTGVAVLIVEDNDDARRMLAAIIERCGATVATASGPAEAIGLLDASPPDIILSDIEMPGEDGYSFIRKVRLRPAPTGLVPAIALTAYNRSEDRVRSLAAGFQMHIGKPVEPGELVAALRSLLLMTPR